jgi:hypothetical protein
MMRRFVSWKLRQESLSQAEDPRLLVRKACPDNHLMQMFKICRRQKIDTYVSPRIFINASPNLPRLVHDAHPNHNESERVAEGVKAHTSTWMH